LRSTHLNPMTFDPFLTNLIIGAYFTVGAMPAARKLVVQFGQQDADYRSRVSMLFPVKWAGKVLSGRG